MGSSSTFNTHGIELATTCKVLDISSNPSPNLGRWPRRDLIFHFFDYLMGRFSFDSTVHLKNDCSGFAIIDGGCIHDKYAQQLWLHYWRIHSTVILLLHRCPWAIHFFSTSLFIQKLAVDWCQRKGNSNWLRKKEKTKTANPRTTKSEQWKGSK